MKTDSFKNVKKYSKILLVVILIFQISLSVIGMHNVLADENQKNNVKDKIKEIINSGVINDVGQNYIGSQSINFLPSQTNPNISNNEDLKSYALKAFAVVLSYASIDPDNNIFNVGNNNWDYKRNMQNIIACVNKYSGEENWSDPSEEQITGIDVTTKDSIEKLVGYYYNIIATGTDDSENIPIYDEDIYEQSNKEIQEMLTDLEKNDPNYSENNNETTNENSNDNGILSFLDGVAGILFIGFKIVPIIIGGAIEIIINIGTGEKISVYNLLFNKVSLTKIDFFNQASRKQC